MGLVCDGRIAVFESENKLRHLPFFEEIASRDESQSDWRAARAGLVVLRLVDAWLDEGGDSVTDWSVRSVRLAVDDIDHGTPIRSILGRIIDALNEQKPDIHVVITPLMAFGRALEYDAKWTMAADVYHSVLAHLHPVDDSDASIAAHLRLGQCYRNLHSIEDAIAAFSSASDIATAVGDMVGILRARVGEARIAILRGNLPKAEEILDDTIARATGETFRDVRSRALHDRSEVARKRGQYELAIRFAYSALRQSENPSERDRILSDIAVAFLDLGVFSAARDAYLVLFATAQEQYIRWSAALNLLEVSSLTGSEPLFEYYRRHLAQQPLPPYMATAFALNVGLGHERFGNGERARVALRKAMALAEEHGINEYLFQAEEALLGLDARTLATRPPVQIPLDLTEVADAIRDLKHAAGVS